MKICINAGHCPGLDSGAVNSITGLQEAHVTHDVMQEVMYHLQQAGYETLEVQENQLGDITKASNNFGADLFLSIHCNAATSDSAQGTETFCYSPGGIGEKLATCIQNQIVKSMETVDRGVKFANFQVLRETDCPAVLVELAFITNEDDEKLLTSNEGKENFAKAISRGVTDYVAGA